MPTSSRGRLRQRAASVPSMTKGSQTLDDVRVSGDENSGMHMAVSRGSDAIGTAGRGPEHVAEGGLALADRASLGGRMRHDGDHAAQRHFQADGVALAGTLPGGRCRWPLARQEPASGRAPLDPAIKTLVLTKTMRETPPDATHWSVRSMARAVGISHTSVQNIWREYGLKPHLGIPSRFRTTLRSRRSGGRGRPLPRSAGQGAGLFGRREEPDSGPRPHPTRPAHEEGPGPAP